MEVTRRCDLKCPVCFASAGEETEDPSVESLLEIFCSIADRTPHGVLQLSGGEPAIREDLPDLVRGASQMNFAAVQLNTNGLRLAEEPGLSFRLKECGLSWVYLQFDGTDDQAWSVLRGRPLLAQKERAVENCAAAGLGVVLVVTVKRGVNDHLLGDIIRFGVKSAPIVRGIHFQPMAFFGRYPFSPSDEERTTLPDVMRGICVQHEFFRMDDFSPCSGQHPSCSFAGEFLVSSGGMIERKGVVKPPKEDTGLLRATSRLASRWTLSEEPSGNEEGFDRILAWRRRLFTITAMAFQDVWTIDTARLQRCPIKAVTADGRFIPFCSFTATSSSGRSLYGKNS